MYIHLFDIAYLYITYSISCYLVNALRIRWLYLSLIKHAIKYIMAHWNHYACIARTVLYNKTLVDIQEGSILEHSTEAKINKT